MKYSLLLLGGIAASPLFESEKSSKTILKREKRNNNGIFEETFGANLERECVEEICSFDEVMEVFEDQTAAEDWWQKATNQCAEPDACGADGTKTCVNQWQKHTCECKDGWKGDKCTEDIDECEEADFCQNAGVCTNFVGGFSCQCTDGWEGDNCENDKDECAAGYCKNGAGCENEVGSFTCQCTAQWQGATCEEDVNECELSNPCANSGVCINEIGDYRCLCNSGWGGKDCDQDYDECADAHCPAGTVCVQSGMNQFTCECPDRGCANLNETEYNMLIESANPVEEVIVTTAGSDYNNYVDIDSNSTESGADDFVDSYDSVDDSIDSYDSDSSYDDVGGTDSPVDDFAEDIDVDDNDVADATTSSMLNDDQTTGFANDSYDDSYDGAY